MKAIQMLDDFAKRIEKKDFRLVAVEYVQFNGTEIFGISRLNLTGCRLIQVSEDTREPVSSKDALDLITCIFGTFLEMETTGNLGETDNQRLLSLCQMTRTILVNGHDSLTQLLAQLIDQDYSARESMRSYALCIWRQVGVRCCHKMVSGIRKDRDPYPEKLAAECCANLFLVAAKADTTEA